MFLFLYFIKKRAPASILGNIPTTDIYESVDLCPDAQQIENVRIVRYEDSIQFANAESFGHAVFRKLDIETDKLLKQLDLLKPIEVGQKPARKRHLFKNRNKVNVEATTTKKKTDGSNEVSDVKEEKDDEPRKGNLQIDELLHQIGFRHLILDCSCVNTVDIMGVNALLQVKINSDSQKSNLLNFNITWKELA